MRAIRSPEQTVFAPRRWTGVAGLATALAAAIALAGCPAPRTAADAVPPRPDTAAFLDTLQERTFRFFWDLTPPNGLTPDRAPTPSFASVAGTGFALTAFAVGSERGYVTREAARGRVLAALRHFWTAPQDSTPSGAAGHRGFFYHFLDPRTGHRFERVELSTVDTALLMAGVLFCQSYFDRDHPDEGLIRALAESLYVRVDWRWASVRAPLIGHGWTPEDGFLPYDWGGYNEAMILYLLALGSPRHAVEPEAWAAWARGYRWGTFHGQEDHLGFAPLFGHQYTHVWVDLRGIRDGAMRARGLDYFENSRRAVLAQRAYALANPGGWAGYGPGLWGLSACDGPVNGTYTVGGRARTFHTYWARGASFTAVEDDGTFCPSAAAASIAFAPEVVIPALLSLVERYGEHVYARYGFLDALNPTFQLDVPVQHGRVVPGVGWFDTDYLAIDQGPIVAMIENHRSDLVWRTLRGNPHLVRGLRRAGFTGGWLDDAPEEP
jgi:hypothetical protein